MNETKPKQDSDQKETPNEKLVEGRDYYFENEFMVLTEVFLRKRGYCCENGCRHCPYSIHEKSLQKKSL